MQEREKTKIKFNIYIKKLYIKRRTERKKETQKEIIKKYDKNIIFKLFVTAGARVAITTNATKIAKGGEFIISFPPFQKRENRRMSRAGRR